MKKLICILIALTTFGFCHAKARYAGEHEMIAEADYIVIVNISKVEKSDKKGSHWTYRQKASATVEYNLKGNLKGDIEIYGMESFICAQCRYTKGRFILFLRKNNGLLVGSNWQLGILPITEEMLPWFKNVGNRFEREKVSLDKVKTIITGILKEQELCKGNTLWAKMLNEGSKLYISHNTAITEDDYKEMADNNGFRNLKDLTIRYNKSLTDSTIKQFCKAPIETLHLSGDSFSNDGLMELLKSLKNLKSLNLSYTKLSDKGLSVISGENLKNLVIYKNQITDKALFYISKFSNLSCLSIDEKSLSDKGLFYISKLSKLSYLSIEGANLTDKGYVYLSNKGYVHFSKLHQLKELRVKDSITDEAFSYMKDIPLEKVYLYDLEMTKPLLTSISGVKSLKTLELSKCSFSYSVLSALSGTKLLKKLILTNCTIRYDEIEKYRKQHPTIKVIIQ